MIPVPDPWRTRGVILFEMAAGTKPFGRGVAEIFYRQTNLEAPLLRTRRPELPEAFETIVRQCLEREPDRFR